MDQKEEDLNLSGISLNNVKGDIELKDVSFNYETSGEILHDVNLRIKHGTMLALVGESGGGKTTICHIIPRFYKINSGHILIDGHDIDDLNIVSLRDNIGIVQQDVFLFNGTIRDNILYGKLDATEEELNAAFRPNTKLMFGETIANPALTVLDIEKFARAAHSHGVPLIVDNTFATPINCRPFEWGADIVVHSTTKYMDGHAGAIGGAIVDSGSFDWTKHPDKYPGLCTPDESYHGVTYTERFGLAGAYITKATVQLMRDLGAIQSPQSAYYLNLGLESLHVRMKRHCENAQRVAEFLQQHENVSWVQYCGLPGDKYYELGQKYLPHGSCGVVSFGVKGGRAAAEAVMGRLKVASIETHVADSHTCCLHPASTTHRQMNAEELLAAGVREDLIRYSCGLEDAEDLIADLDQALQ